MIGNRYTTEEIKRMRSLYLAGYSTYDIAKIMGCGPGTAQIYCRDITRGKGGAKRRIDYEKAKEIYLTGASSKEIAFELNCSYGHALKILKKLGLIGLR